MRTNEYDVVFFPDVLNRGGAERVTIRLSEYMVRRGLKVAIMTTNLPCDGEYEVPEIVDRISVGVNTKNIFRLVKEYYKVIKKYRFKIGILMGLPQGCYIIPACMMNHIKLIVCERNSPANFDGRRITRILMSFFMKFGVGYVFQTEQASEYYNNKIKGPRKIIGNPIDINSIPEKKNYGIPKKFVSVGRLAPQKNQQLMIKAFSVLAAKYPDITLTIYGEGNLRVELEKLIERLELTERIQLPGVQTDILELERDFDVFLFSSDFEGIPNALLEAMAIGLPCISTDCPCGGPASVINNWVNGILVPVGDLDALSRALDWMINNPLEAKAMGEKAKQIKKELEISKIGEQWIDFIKDIEGTIGK